MTYRVNGTGTTVSPMPTKGGISIAMKWFTVLFIPLIPLGWHLIQAGDSDGLNTEYTILKKLTYAQVKEALGSKGIFFTVGYSFCTGLVALVLFVVAVLFFGYLRSFF